jgi:hypothetical protein
MKAMSWSIKMPWASIKRASLVLWRILGALRKACQRLTENLMQN